MDAMAAESSSFKENADLEEQRESLACDSREISSPILVRFHAGHFRIILSLSSNAFLWRTIRESNLFRPWISKADLETEVIHVTIWTLSLFFLVALSFAYILKCLFHMEIVRKEYMHRIKSNYLFVPWISATLQVLSVPTAIHNSKIPVSPWVAVVLTAPIVMLELKIYGQWYLGGRSRILSRRANPTTHISVLGNFIGAILLAKTGWKEVAVLFFSVGMVHYVVLFVTLYQKLPSTSQLPRHMHPVYFLFIAAPSCAGIAWQSISGAFEDVSKMPFFLALFLFMSLIVRLNLFKGLRYSLVWWATAFPLNTLAIASIIYAEENISLVSRLVAIFFAVVSNVALLVLCIITVFRLTHAIVTRQVARIPKSNQSARQKVTKNLKLLRVRTIRLVDFRAQEVKIEMNVSTELEIETSLSLWSKFQKIINKDTKF